MLRLSGRLFWVAAMAVAWVEAACGGNAEFTVAQPTDAGADGSVGGYGGTGAAAGSGGSAGIGGYAGSGGAGGSVDGGGPYECPPNVPTQGQLCAPSGMVCGYGDSVRIDCRMRAECGNGTWSVPLKGCPPIPGPGQGGCPKGLDAGLTDCVGQEGAVCDMGTLAVGASCECSQCGGAGPCSVTPRWWCAKAPTTAGCPALAPNIGQKCSPDGLWCHYGICGTPTSAGRTCKNGVWLETMVTCPL